MVKNRAEALVIDLDHVAERIRNRVILFRMLTVLAGQLRARMDARYRAAGITTQQAAVLALASVASPPTQGEVASLLGVTQQNVRQIADALVRKGLLEVHPQADDRRVKRLVSTRRVARLFARRNADDFAAVATWFSVLDDVVVAALLEQLGRLLAALNPTDAPVALDASRAALESHHARGGRSTRRGSCRSAGSARSSSPSSRRR